MTYSNRLTPARVFGLILAVVHLVLFVSFSVRMNFGSQDAMSGMLWGIWRTLDFPVSLAAFYGFLPAPLEWNAVTTLKFVYPYLVHGILGTAWWFLIPLLVAGFFNRILRLRRHQR